jgi:hypothetical protein
MIGYPFDVLIWTVDRGANGHCLMKIHRRRAPVAVDPVHETVDIFHAFFNRKIIPKI